MLGWSDVIQVEMLARLLWEDDRPQDKNIPYSTWSDLTPHERENFRMRVLSLISEQSAQERTRILESQRLGS